MQHSSRRMLAMVDAYVADDAADADAQKVRLAVGEYGRRGVKRSVVARKLHFSKKRMDAAEATLLDRGEIELKSGRGEGPAGDSCRAEALSHCSRGACSADRVFHL